HSVTDDEEIGNGKTDVIGLDFFDSAGGLVQQCGDAQAFGFLLQENLAQVGESEAGVEDVFNDEDVLAFDWLVEVLYELDSARGALAYAIARCGDKVECGVCLNGAREIDEKERSAFQHAHHDQLFAVQIAADLGAHLCDAL